MLENKIRAMVAEVYGVGPDAIKHDTRWSELGGDSLDLIELGFAVEEQFGVHFAECGETITFGELVGRVSDIFDGAATADTPTEN